MEATKEATRERRRKRPSWRRRRERREKARGEGGGFEEAALRTRTTERPARRQSAREEEGKQKGRQRKKRRESERVGDGRETSRANSPTRTNCFTGKSFRGSHPALRFFSKSSGGREARRRNPRVIVGVVRAIKLAPRSTEPRRYSAKLSSSTTKGWDRRYDRRIGST